MNNRNYQVDQADFLQIWRFAGFSDKSDDEKAIEVLEAESNEILVFKIYRNFQYK